MKASLMRPIPPGSTRSVSTGSSAAYTNAALPVEITEKRIGLSDDSNDYVTRTHVYRTTYTLLPENIATLWYTKIQLSVSA